ncbi:MAG: hypothetical protein ABL914_00330 [Novosphingobium sp.]|uniref:hypothetical protein n=1 Tax=Novosphingobium sp. TaxID=1874826 RepID=UPI0032BBB36B
MKAAFTLLIAAGVSGLLGSAPADSRRAAGPPIPAGWKIDASADGDLNGDGVTDAAVVIRQVNAGLIVQNAGLGAQELDTNPRHLLVFAKTAQGFRQIAAAAKLIPPAGSDGNPCLADPLEEGGISIAKQVLSVKLHYWQSCGSWGVTSNTYRFKLQTGRFRLIGYDRMEFMRNSGEGEELSVNFLTRKKSTAPFAIDDSVPKRPRWTRIKPQRFYLDTLDLDACPKIDASTYLC